MSKLSRQQEQFLFATVYKRTPSNSSSHSHTRIEKPKIKHVHIKPVKSEPVHKTTKKAKNK